MQLKTRLGDRVRSTDAWVHQYAIPMTGSLLITTGVALWLFS